jgi:hypothetical protein
MKISCDILPRLKALPREGVSYWKWSIFELWGIEAGLPPASDFRDTTLSSGGGHRRLALAQRSFDREWLARLPAPAGESCAC